MTREEAITRIKDHMSVHKICEERAVKITEALNMAIKALETQPDGDTISRRVAIDAIENFGILDGYSDRMELTSAQPESTRTFVELVVEYPDPEVCTYKEYKGKPYYSIKYIENGETYVGYGTYNPEVLSQYLKEYFISSEQPEIIRCRDCEHFMRWLRFRSEGSAKKFGQEYECECGRLNMPEPDDFCSRPAPKENR